MAKEIQRETIRQIALRAKAMGGRAMLVGGCVRDALLGRESADIDCEVYGLTPEQLHALAAQFGTVDESGARYGIFTLKDAGIDLAVPRLERRIGPKHGDAVTLTVRRDGQTLDLTITPFYDEDDGRYRVGFSFGRENMRLPIWSSIPFSVQYNIESVKTILDALKNMVFRGKGVDGTIYVIQEVTRQGGFEVYLEMLALISVNLGVMNLLPIPGLDGSRLLFLLVEAIRRKPVKRELEGAIHLAGFALLMGLMVLLTYKDIIRFFVKG